MSGSGAVQWLQTHTRTRFITSLWSIFLTIGRWEEFSGQRELGFARRRPPPQQHPRPWAWQDGSDTSHVDPSLLARWLGTHAGVTPDRARDFLEPYTCRRERDVYYSHTAQAAHNRVQSKRDWKNPHGLYGGTRRHTFRGEPSSSAPTHSVGLAARLSAAHGNPVPPPLLTALWLWMRTLRRCHWHRYPPRPHHGTWTTPLSPALLVTSVRTRPTYTREMMPRLTRKSFMHALRTPPGLHPAGEGVSRMIFYYHPNIIATRWLQ